MDLTGPIWTSIVKFVIHIEKKTETKEFALVALRSSNVNAKSNCIVFKCRHMKFLVTKYSGHSNLRHLNIGDIRLKMNA